MTPLAQSIYIWWWKSYLNLNIPTEKLCKNNTPGVFSQLSSWLKHLQARNSEERVPIIPRIIFDIIRTSPRTSWIRIICVSPVATKSVWSVPTPRTMIVRDIKDYLVIIEIIGDVAFFMGQISHGLENISDMMRLRRLLSPIQRSLDFR